jgi:hypothetical protein
MTKILDNSAGYSHPAGSGALNENVANPKDLKPSYVTIENVDINSNDDVTSHIHVIKHKHKNSSAEQHLNELFELINSANSNMNELKSQIHSLSLSMNSPEVAQSLAKKAQLMKKLERTIDHLSSVLAEAFGSVEHANLPDNHPLVQELKNIREQVEAISSSPLSDHDIESYATQNKLNKLQNRLFQPTMNSVNEAFAQKLHEALTQSAKEDIIRQTVLNPIGKAYAEVNHGAQLPSKLENSIVNQYLQQNEGNAENAETIISFVHNVVSNIKNNVPENEFVPTDNIAARARMFADFGISKDMLNAPMNGVAGARSASTPGASPLSGQSQVFVLNQEAFDKAKADGVYIVGGTIIIDGGSASSSGDRTYWQIINGQKYKLTVNVADQTKKYKEATNAALNALLDAMKKNNPPSITVAQRDEIIRNATKGLDSAAAKKIRYELEKKFLASGNKVDQPSVGMDQADVDKVVLAANTASSDFISGLNSGSKVDNADMGYKFEGFLSASIDAKLASSTDWAGFINILLDTFTDGNILLVVMLVMLASTNIDNQSIRTQARQMNATNDQKQWLNGVLEAFQNLANVTPYTIPDPKDSFKTIEVTNLTELFRIAYKDPTGDKNLKAKLDAFIKPLEKVDNTGIWSTIDWNSPDLDIQKKDSIAFTALFKKIFDETNKASSRAKGESITPFDTLDDVNGTAVSYIINSTQIGTVVKNINTSTSAANTIAQEDSLIMQARNETLAQHLKAATSALDTMKATYQALWR